LKDIRFEGEKGGVLRFPVDNSVYYQDETWHLERHYGNFTYPSYLRFGHVPADEYGNGNIAMALPLKSAAIENAAEARMDFTKPNLSGSSVNFPSYTPDDDLTIGLSYPEK
jgi:hypothetical protein